MFTLWHLSTVTRNSIILKYLILLLGLPQTSPKYVPNSLHFILSVKIGNKIIFYFWHHNRKGLWCHWPTVLYFYICKLFLYCMTLKSPHLIEQTRKIMVPNVAMNFLNWWTWWDWTNKENNCTKRCYGLMKELFVYVSIIIDWIDGTFSRYFLLNRWQVDIDKCLLNIIKCQWLSLTYSMALIVRKKSIL